MARILVLTNMYPPHHYGGLELSCADVVRRWRARGHHVEVLTSTVSVDGVTSDPGERAAGVRRDLALYWDDHRLLSPPLVRRYRIERANQRALRDALDDVGPDVVSVWGMGAMSLGLLATVVDRHVPMVCCVCDDWIEYGPRLDAWSRLFVHRPTLGRAVASVTGVPTGPPGLASAATFCWVSDRTRRVAEEVTGQRFPRSTVVASGVDLDTFGRRDPSLATTGDRRDDASGATWRWDLLYVGRVDPRKGIEVAVRALARLPDQATLTVVGRGDEAERARLVSVAAELGVAERVRFTVADRADLAERYARADAVLFTSLWDEPFGLVPLEAMACGTPVIATGRGGSADFLIDDDNCLLYDGDDPAALAAAVTRLAADDPLRARLVAAGHQTADTLSVDRLASTLEAWHLAAATRYADGEPGTR